MRDRNRDAGLKQGREVEGGGEASEEISRFTELLKKVALSSGANLFGTAVFAGKEAEAPPTLPFSLRELPFAVSIGFRLSDSVLDSLVDRPTRTYQYHYRQMNILIDQTLLRLLSAVHELGYRGFPVPASQIVDWQSDTGHLAHKVVAHEAGLGWKGRNNLLITPRYGARVRYGSLFTDMPLTRPPKTSYEGCGTCNACAEICPASAIHDSPEDFELERCRAMLKSFSKSENIGSMICGLCIKACRGTSSPAIL